MRERSVAVIIPSFDRARGGNVARLLEEIRAQTLQPVDVHVVAGIAPSGRARNAGARRTSADLLLFLDDDVRLGHSRLFATMAAAIEDPQVGMVGASQLLPPEASAFQLASSRQIPRSTSAIVHTTTDSDMVTTACCAIRRALFWEVGGFNEEIPRGVDPELRARVRRAGRRIVIAPDTWFYHPMPATVAALCRTFFRNGRQSAEGARLMPAAVLENPDGHTAGFVGRRSGVYRTGRHIWRFFAALVTFRWIGLAAQLSYLTGHLWFRARMLRGQLLQRVPR